jgi:hypothetical protein
MFNERSTVRNSNGGAEKRRTVCVPPRHTSRLDFVLHKLNTGHTFDVWDVNGCVVPFGVSPAAMSH